MIFRYLHPGTEGESLPTAEEVFELYEPENSRWYFPGIVYGLNAFIIRNECKAVELMGQLLDLSRTEFEARIAINPQLNRWRELATAPVQRVGCPQLWV